MIKWIEDCASAEPHADQIELRQGKRGNNYDGVRHVGGRNRGAEGKSKRGPLP